MGNQQTYSFKRGDTFSLGGPVAGLPSGMVLARSELRNPSRSNVLIAELTVSLGDFVDDDTPRDILLEAPATATAAWPIGELACDIEFSEPGGIVISSQTFMVKVVQDITLPL